MTKIKINEKEFELKYTLEAWKKLKEKHEITPVNFQSKIEEDMAGALSALLYYGLLPKDREEVNQDEMDEQMEFKVLGIVSKAIMEGLPEATKSNKGEDTSEKK